jgi:hypothetical protein
MKNVTALQVNIASAYGLLDWSGDDWPQPHAVLGIDEWDWDSLETEMEFDAVRPWSW